MTCEDELKEARAALDSLREQKAALIGVVNDLTENNDRLQALADRLGHSAGQSQRRVNQLLTENEAWRQRLLALKQQLADCRKEAS